MTAILNGIELLLLLGSRLAAGCAALIALLLAIIGTLDIVTTNLIDKAVPGAFELSEVGLMLIIAFGLAVAARNREHIKVDILLNLMPEKLQRICVANAYLFTSVFFFLWTWQMWLMASKSYRIGELAGGLLSFPVYPVKLAVFAGLLFASIETLRRFISALRAVFRVDIDQQ